VHRPKTNPMQPSSVALLSALVSATPLRQAPDLARLVADWVSVWIMNAPSLSSLGEGVRSDIASIMATYTHHLAAALPVHAAPAAATAAESDGPSVPPAPPTPLAAAVALTDAAAPASPSAREREQVDPHALLNVMASLPRLGIEQNAAVADAISRAVKSLATMGCDGRAAVSLLTRCAAVSPAAEDAMVALCARDIPALDAAVAAATGSSAPAAAIRVRAWSAVVRHCKAELGASASPLESPLIAKLLVLSLLQLCAPQPQARLTATDALRFLKESCNVTMPSPPAAPPQHDALQRASALRLSRCVS
jgi:hypothetical protein